MPIEILAGMVVVGLAVAIAAVRFSGLSAPARVADATQAATRFQLDFPAETVVDCRLTAAGDAALLRLASGTTGLVTTFGSKFVTRHLATGAHARANGNEVELTLHDFTFPPRRLGFADAGDARLVAGWVNKETQ